MSNELQCSFASGKTLYYVIRNNVGQAWNTSTSVFENYLSANYTSYSVSATEQGSSGFYVATFPVAIVPGIYSVCGKQQIGGTVAEGDPTVATGDLQWNGIYTLPLSDLATSGQVSLVTPLKLYRGEMVKNFPFHLVGSIDHITDFTSGVCSGQIFRDNGAFTGLQSGAFTEIGLGWYTLQALTSGDLLANTAGPRFNAVNLSGGASDPRDFAFVLQRSSGST